MFDIGWSELLVIGVVALIVIGPKDLPEMFRTLGRFTARARAMAREFQATLEAAAEESGVKDVTDDLKKMTSVKNLGLDSVTDAAKTLTDTSFDPDEFLGKTDKADKGDGKKTGAGTGKKAKTGKGTSSKGAGSKGAGTGKKASTGKTTTKAKAKATAKKTDARPGAKSGAKSGASGRKSTKSTSARAASGSAGKPATASKATGRASKTGKKGSAATAGATGKADS